MNSPVELNPEDNMPRQLVAVMFQDFVVGSFSNKFKGEDYHPSRRDNKRTLGLPPPLSDY